MIRFILIAQTSPDGDNNVALDDERLKDDVPKGLQKVELDLDDALFLEFEEKEEVPETTAVESAPEPEDALPRPEEPEGQPSKTKSRKKLWIFAIAAVLCLLIGSGGAYFFMKSGPPYPDEQTAEQDKSPEAPHADKAESSATPDDSAANETTATPEQIEIYSFERFQVEYSLDGKIRFLTCRISIPGTTEVMRAEFQAKKIFLRDGIYRYLKNSPLSFLATPEESEKMKADIATVVNQIIKSGQVSEILLEEYVVK
jgi:flagellar FliL protein